MRLAFLLVFCSFAQAENIGQTGATFIVRKAQPAAVATASESHGTLRGGKCVVDHWTVSETVFDEDRISRDGQLRGNVIEKRAATEDCPFYAKYDQGIDQMYNVRTYSWAKMCFNEDGQLVTEIVATLPPYDSFGNGNLITICRNVEDLNPTAP